MTNVFKVCNIVVNILIINFHMYHTYIIRILGNIDIELTPLCIIHILI